MRSQIPGSVLKFKYSLNYKENHPLNKEKNKSSGDIIHGWISGLYGMTTIISWIILQHYPKNEK